MHKPDAVALLFIILLVAFAAWSILRARRWEKYQGEAANRSKSIIEATARDRERLNEAVSISREQLEVEKQLLAELKGLREDLKKGTNPVI